MLTPCQDAAEAKEEMTARRSSTQSMSLADVAAAAAMDAGVAPKGHFPNGDGARSQ